MRGRQRDRQTQGQTDRHRDTKIHRNKDRQTSRNRGRGRHGVVRGSVLVWPQACLGEDVGHRLRRQTPVSAATRLQAHPCAQVPWELRVDLPSQEGKRRQEPHLRPANQSQLRQPPLQRRVPEVIRTAPLGAVQNQLPPLGGESSRNAVRRSPTTWSRKAPCF